ncbi:hypothetical protein [Pontibacter anaerobius]|uniref:Uncharacterized protein n=1 Tax=Pontibacter anaerobius TaxID=2993940 RepID=A0ABT3RES0_9BACT|nr:hypothetical protein [Pontibacter anaerobius]MCX2740040.1 hypothetical protein [Pontibacter anaerobius]
MPSPRESNINDFAFDYLRNHYATRFGAKHILVDKEEQTRQGHSTQGLFSFKMQDNALYVAVLHTEQSPLITKTLTRYKKKGLSKLRYLTSFLVLVLVAVAAWQLGYFALGLAAAVLLAAVTFTLHTLAEEKLKIRKFAHLLDEFRKTPADEQWLGLSISSLTFRNNYLAKQLLAMCARRGIGVITVGQRAKVVLQQEPKPTTCRRGDFLSHYQSDARIRKALLGDTVLRVA